MRTKKEKNLQLQNRRSFFSYNIYITSRRGTSVSTANRLWVGRPDFYFQQGQERDIIISLRLRVHTKSRAHSSSNPNGGTVHQPLQYYHLSSII